VEEGETQARDPLILPSETADEIFDGGTQYIEKRLEMDAGMIEEHLLTSHRGG